MTTTEPVTTLLAKIALIACGCREGKTQGCVSCARKAPMLLDIASAGALDALTAAICGGYGSTCQECRSKAETIINETMEMPCAI
ncbi:hypothetical protein OG413_20490 [Streptomyces sp. NBC_01433]|uniref:hypothetical protein n=1 Tax=Streptomyces sp. NBC_01433 TaxID=2903864 RepID=UPI0022545F30|nr:hypothetical protein [Streptomyces sp. NBC_01433]MCX4677653.1 hypothetical protein [Streptomyces sp. NBC_01433]